MSTSNAHSCIHCQKLTLDLIDGSTDYIERSGVPQNGLVFNFNLNDVKRAYADGCSLIEPIVSKWLLWDETALSRWESRADEIVLFADIDNAVINLENNTKDFTEIQGFCLWDRVALKRTDRVSAGSFHVFATADDPAAKYVNTRPIAPRPGSQDYFSKIRQYLDDCLHRVGVHTECDASVTGKAPTRLLKLSYGSHGGYDIRIEHPIGPVKYVALSYCWGGEQVHKTTSKRLPAYSRNVSWENLPKTVQDAVKVTAALDIEYLWVDSICIIQDDNDDKAREIANMPDIYNEATVTIVAATAKAAGDGFLHDRDPLALTGSVIRLPFKCPGGQVGSVYLTEMGELQFDEHIDTRAWTLQESYLSKRLLRFGNKQCSLLCQCSPSKPRVVDGWKSGQEYDVRYLENIIFLRTLNVKDDIPALKAFYTSTFGVDLEYDVAIQETEHGDFIDMWRDLVEAYTTRSLSVSEDRCIAISGLADRISPLLDTRYVAGHWERFLPADLLWRVTTPQPNPKTYQGPSWSWTSVNGPVHFYKALRDTSLKVQDVELELDNPKVLFGAVKRGTLHVWGKLLKTSWTGQEICLLRSEIRETLFSGAVLVDMFWPDAEEMDFLKSGNSGSSIEPSEGESTAQTTSQNPVDPSLQPVIYFLEICAPGQRTGSGSIGVVLREGISYHSPSSRFSRIGLFDFTVYTNIDQPEDVPNEEWQAFLDRRDHYFDTLEPREIEIE